MGKLSRDKGKVGERETVKTYRSWGLPDPRRSQQVDGSLSSDVVVPVLPDLHTESKRYAKIGAMRFMDQAVADAAGVTENGRPYGKDPLPVVVMREDHGEQVIMLRTKDVPRFVGMLSDLGVGE